MTKQAAIKKLETVMGKLLHLNYNIENNSLGTAIRQVANVMDNLRSSETKVKK